MSVTEYLEQDWESIKVDLSKIDSKLRDCDQYYMFQFGDKCHSLNMTLVHRQLRGAVVDKTSKQIVSRTYAVPTEIKPTNMELLDSLKLTKVNIKIQTLYDGTLLRLSYFSDKWNLLTNGKISAYNSLWQSPKNFGKYFDEFIHTINNENENINNNSFYDSLNRDLTYIFTMCHPETTIVVNYDAPKLYLLTTINNSTGVEYAIGSAEATINKDVINLTDVQFHDISVDEAIDNALSGKVTDGYVFIDQSSAVSLRYRLQSTVYSKNESILGTRNVDPSQRSTYLYHFIVDIIRVGNVPQMESFLKAYPNHSQLFDKYFNAMRYLPQTLHDIYIQKHVKRSLQWIDGSHRHKFIKSLHDLYLNTLRPQKLCVNINTVVYMLSKTSTTELVAMLGE